MEPHYYSVDLTKKEYGTPSAPDELNFVWQKNDDGNYVLVKSTDDTQKDLTFRYSNENTSTRLENPTGDINKNFIDNEISSSTTSIYGGAIYNKDNNTGTITGDFVNTSITATRPTYGVAIYNENGTIDGIKGNFVNNTIEKTGSSYGYGGAIYNTKNGKISSIEGNFIANTIKAGNTTTHGGAIYNRAEIGDITGDFIGNGVQNSGSRSDLNGGAIYNNKSSIIGNIKGNFINNYSIHTGTYVGFGKGAAIYNESGNIGNIEGDFVNNYTLTDYGSGQGAAIYNDSGVLQNITGDFIGNHIEVKNVKDSAYIITTAVLFTITKVKSVILKVTLSATI